MNNDNKIFADLERFALLIPTPMSWIDVNGIVLGGNDLVFQAVGARKRLIGKSLYEFYSKEVADVLMKNTKQVIKEKRSITFEESVGDVASGETIWFLTTRAPLFSDDGTHIIAIICTSLEITDKKKTESLAFENELQKSKLQEQEKFRAIAEQVAHDIRSPLASLSMIVGACKNIPEPERITLREVATGIGDIANNLLCSYKKDWSEADDITKAPQHILASLALAEILSSKKYQYKHSLVKFNCSIEPEGNFVFIEANLSNFSRMISNLINNAVEALDGKNGTVDLSLILDGEQVKVTVQDNGKGMPQEIIDKIMNNISVTSGKKNGCGIGLAQVRGTLHSSNGKMIIESKIGKGTKITLVFPRVEIAEWVTDKIELHKGDTVIVLDDDSSIHGAWKARFKPYKYDIQLQHFKLGKEAIEFISNLTPHEKEKALFLSDFELINQELNGLQVIELTAMQKRSLLVTSHHNNQKIHDLATQMGVKILPKQLVSDVIIKIKELENNIVIEDHCKKVDLVIIDDVQIFADSMACFFQSKSLTVDTYYCPKRFLENIDQYNKDTKICMDNDFGGKISGFELAKQLNAAGYTQLYMLSGKEFEKKDIPNYLTVLLKGDMDALNKLCPNT